MPHTHLFEADGDVHVTASSADHHSHGMRILDHEVRVPASGVALPSAPAYEGPALVPADLRVLRAVPDDTLRPTGRAPPCGNPRAPPDFA